MSDKRLSAAEVVLELRAELARYCGLYEARYNYSCGGRDATHAAILLVKQHLVPQWQAEPTGEGWYWVRAKGKRHDSVSDAPRYVAKAGRTWRVWIADQEGYDEWHSECLNGRRVCPISGPPQ